MLRILTIVALRNLLRHKFFSAINIAGLTIGFASSMMIWMYVSHELSYDQFHEKADQIYRINQTYIWGDDDVLFASTGPAVKKALLDEIPEFEEITRVHTPGNQLISVQSDQEELIVFDESTVLAADDNFFKVFTFPLLHGSKEQALMNPNSLVITEETAIRYFGTDKAVGKVMQIGEQGSQKTYKVTGVAASIPDASHIQFDLLLSMKSFPRVERAGDSWMWTTFVTFGLLRPDADPQLVATKVAEVPGKYLEPFLQKYRGISYKEFLASGETWHLYLQPMLDIHLRSTDVYSRLSETSDMQIIWILVFVGGMIIALSLINYINLSTAKATSRAKEIGIRKIIGSGKIRLILQFVMESAVFVLLSLALSVILVELLLPVFNTMIVTNFSLLHALTPLSWVILLGSLTLISLLSSLYPAMILSAFQPAAIIKGTISGSYKEGNLRNVLIAAQFAISILMISSTLIIADQIQYWKSLDLGFDRENQLIIKNVQRLGQSIVPFTESIKSFSEVEYVSISSDTPPLIFDFDNFSMVNKESINLAVNYITIDEVFLDTYQIKLTNGRNLSRAFNDTQNILVNAQFTRSFDFASPELALNEEVLYNDSERFKIVGIIDDFETSLSNQTYPTILFDDSAPIFRNPSTHITVKMSTSLDAANSAQFLDKISALWVAQNSNAPFHYTFADLEYLSLFRENIRFGKLISSLSVLAICIACLGLLGLVAFVIEKRKKEIGIRKVLGASIESLWLLLSSRFGILLISGFLVGGPLSWLLMDEWMSDFAVRKELSIWPILISWVIMLLISALTISFQLINAARANPVHYLHED
jgi:putative ABC transport system permease protein